MVIGITGVTGKLGAYTADIMHRNGIRTVHLARTPEKAKFYDTAELRRMTYEYTERTVKALKGIDVLLLVSARENPKRVEEHKAVVDAAKEAGVRHIVYTSFYGNSADAVFTLGRDHAATEAYIKESGLIYTFLRDNFYLDFFIELCKENGEIRGPAGDGLVSAVARRDTSAVAAKILENPTAWENRTLQLTGPQNLSMAMIADVVGKALGKVVVYHDETVEEAYRSRLKWPAEQWEYDAWVSTYTAIRAGEQAGVSADVELVLGRKATSLLDLLT